MSFEIVLLSAMTFIGAEIQTSYKNNECFSAIPAFWQQVATENFLTTIKDKKEPEVILGLYTGYSKDFGLTSGHYSFIIATPVNKIEKLPENNNLKVISKEIPACKYAVFTAKGPFAKSIGKTWMEIWNTKGLERTFTNDFELYDINSTNDENSIVKIYVAIK